MALIMSKNVSICEGSYLGIIQRKVPFNLRRCLDCTNRTVGVHLSSSPQAGVWGDDR